MLAFVLLLAQIATPAPDAGASPSPQRLLGMIRAEYRSHRPPPPYETYTLIRKQLATNGYPDPLGSYTVHIWVRNSDRAALTRFVYRDDARGDLTFDRPAFNEDRDPGPPTADVFEPAPLRHHPVAEVPTPEPNYTPPPLIGGVRTLLEFDYTVTSVETVGDQLHLHVEPRRDVDRNRLREIWCDKNTLELHKLIATDKLFDRDAGNHVYAVIFTITMGNVQGLPVVTDLHGVVGKDSNGEQYVGDGQDVDYQFRDITFPASLPAWYFDPRTYAQHQNDAPS
ncbi:MAG: hypothetical protein ABSD03_07415 [Vulcanimicrobiaceae bacterium]|jgi:hypothetical protein